MATAIVTGATSYIGIELVVRLTLEGFNVHVIKRTDSNITRLISRVSDINIHTYNGTQKSLTNIFSTVRPDIVFHLAGKYVREESAENIEELIASNITFGSQILAAASNSNVKNFINTGSYFQFSNNNLPPVNFYGVTKNSFLSILDYYADLKNFSATSLIIFDTFGPRDWRSKLFPTIAKAIQHDLPLSIPKNEIFLYPVYYTDVIDCYILAAKKLARNQGNISGNIFAVRDKSPQRINEIIATFEKISGKKIIIKYGDWPKPSKEVESIWRGTTLPSWQPKYNLSQGIKSMLKE